MTDPATTPTLQNFEAAMTDFESILTDNQSNRGKLWLAWHYLQVFSIYGVRLDNTVDKLKSRLQITNPGAYPFFNQMLESYQKVQTTCDYFLRETFPKVVGLGNKLKNFAEAASEDGDAIFEFIVQMVKKGNIDAAITALTNLQKQATDNSNEAANIAVVLSTYSTQLVTADAALKGTADRIEADDRVSMARITELQGGSDMVGSIANLQLLMKNRQDEYDHDVIVAATTPTYAWVFPFGTIAAAIIAGVYGKKAVDALQQYEEMKQKVAGASAELQTAIAMHSIQGLADQGVTSVLKQTDVAIVQVTVVKNAWASVAGNLEDVKDKLLDMSTDTNGTVTLNDIDVIEYYAEMAGKKWAKLMGPINELTDNPYISMASDEIDPQTLIQQINSELHTTASRN
jgi:hypothetical protein